MSRVSALIVLLLSASLSAHDFWIEPTSFAADPGTIVGVKLRVGEHLAGDPVPRDTASIERFVARDRSVAREVFGRDGMDPAGVLRIESPGLQVIGYRSRPSAVALTAEKFNQYLKEEGLDQVLVTRARRNETGAGAREIFSRAAKALILSGPASTKDRDVALGFRLELVAEANPYLLPAGETLPVRLLFEGKPLAGALVVAFNRYRPLTKLSARTDAHGRVALAIADPGMWLIKAVHMVPAAADADWESIWASLTFDMPAASRPHGR